MNLVRVLKALCRLSTFNLFYLHFYLGSILLNLACIVFLYGFMLFFVDCPKSEMGVI